MVLRVRPCLHQQLCLICHFYTQATIILQNQGLGTTLLGKIKLSYFNGFGSLILNFGKCLDVASLCPLLRAIPLGQHFIFILMPAESPVAVVLSGWWLVSEYGNLFQI